MMFQITVMTSSAHSYWKKAILTTDRNIYKRKNETATYKTAKCHTVPSDSKGCGRTKGMRPSNLRFFVVSLSPTTKRLSLYHKTGHEVFLLHPFQFPAILKHATMKHNLHSLKSVITKFKSQSKWPHKHHQHHSTSLLVVKLYKAKWYTLSPRYPPSRFAILRYSESQISIPEIRYPPQIPALLRPRVRQNFIPRARKKFLFTRRISVGIYRSMWRDWSIPEWTVGTFCPLRYNGRGAGVVTYNSMQATWLGVLGWAGNALLLHLK
jgi:hypothetical protein